MGGREFQREKEKVAQLMREKQAAGKTFLISVAIFPTTAGPLRWCGPTCWPVAHALPDRESEVRERRGSSGPRHKMEVPGTVC